MRQLELIMGMPITVDIVGAPERDPIFATIFGHFAAVDERFSTYKPSSEISQINRGALSLAQASADMRQIFALAEQTRRETGGFFDIAHGGRYDPSGLVKGWAIYGAAELLWRAGYRNFFVDAGGDIQTSGRNAEGQPWRVGIRNPFNIHEIVRVIAIETGGVATSGSSIRGQHIYNPQQPGRPVSGIVSVTVIGPNIYEADRFATAAFAMGRDGIIFLEQRTHIEGYMIDDYGIATLTSGCARYLLPAEQAG
jgi:thiamine biosynthesis lipoprotein